MANNRIKVYARLKKEGKLDNPLLYEIVTQKGYDILQIFQDNTLRGRAQNFRYSKVFNTCAKQDVVFEVIAKPIITSVLNGFNGTVFAYGQTGSGKTYSLTGSHSKFEERGIIPRAIEYIFKFIEKNSSSEFNISISYLEIYNEVAYDLLNPKQNFATLEELPRVMLLEDHKGKAHFKNLSIRQVYSEREAMKFLFLGDTNRIIAETPMNEYSSRSHCVFTLHIASREKLSGKVVKAKLNLVDLAGSERFCKAAIPNENIKLNEVKHINLSLHYLERVIIALSESKRSHIPYRNSLMTLILRDSLAGNCLTAMLATLNVLKPNFQETLSTCRFAQRVAMVHIEPYLNAEKDTDNEIAYLRSEMDAMRRKLFEREFVIKEYNSALTHEEEHECEMNVKSFILGSVTELNVEDPRKVKLYMKLLKNEVLKKKQAKDEEKYKNIIAQKEQEILFLKNLCENAQREEEKFCVLFHNTYVTFDNLTNSEKIALEMFLSNSSYKSQLEFHLKTISEKYDQATRVSNSISEAQKHVSNLKKEIANNLTDVKIGEELTFLLRTEQNSYKELLLKLENIRGEIEYLKKNLRLLKVKILEEFKVWFENQDHLRIISGNIKSKSMVSMRGGDSGEQSGSKSLIFLHENSGITHNSSTQVNSAILQTSKSEQIPKYSNENMMAGGDCIHSNNTIDVSSRRGIDASTNTGLPASPSPSPDGYAAVATNVLGEKAVNNVIIVNKRESLPIKCQTPKTTHTEYSNVDNNIKQQKQERKENQHYLNYIHSGDTDNFISFLKNVPMTGDKEVDEEIVKFYRLKFRK